MSSLLADYNYALPEEKIAKYPPSVRGKSKLLVLNRSDGSIIHQNYQDLVDYLVAGDLLILNNTKVIQARLLTKSAKGQEVEVIILEKHASGNSNSTYQTQVAQFLYRGKLTCNSKLTLETVEIEVVNIFEGGTAELRILGKQTWQDLINSYGHTPIPPYLKRTAELLDKERYQTLFAKNPGSVAAPTASLNFTEELETKLRQKGVQIAYITLHVGLGTFLPIRSTDLKDHTMHQEYYAIPLETVKAIQQVKANPKSRLIALGTTVTRALEHAAPKLSRAGATITGEADIFIYPGYTFQTIDCLLTNFHAPKSTVLMLVAALAGWNKLTKAYEVALQSDYRFLSYGDSMLILG